jgi:hypothetical protein
MRNFKLLKDHVYREFPNKNGHGNDKPSYWAMGYYSLGDYRASVTKKAFLKYCKDHFNCCGVRKLDKDFLDQVRSFK